MNLLEKLQSLTGSFKLSLMLMSSLISFIILVVYRILKKIYYTYYVNSLSQDTEKIQVTKVQFIREILNWCIETLGLPKKNNVYPRLKIIYYKNKKHDGIYLPANREIVIYWNNHTSLLELIDTTIHEYQHFLDFKNNKNFKAYVKATQETGYHDNYFEIRARETAAKHRKACYIYLKKKNIIK